MIFYVAYHLLLGYSLFYVSFYSFFKYSLIALILLSAIALMKMRRIAVTLLLVYIALSLGDMIWFAIKLFGNRNVNYLLLNQIPNLIAFALIARYAWTLKLKGLLN
ncbi:MAG: hypothetical protein A2901_04180 [Elusimicrobia bacterium RIFCSPLOWO2_01_FULL_54_10]|nr:MAG: hypothetical protein A2901_04180 [Elusimicrobia bacterium RIFCSPLOWO2_01_FULL_54_10]